MYSANAAFVIVCAFIITICVYIYTELSEFRYAILYSYIDRDIANEMPLSNLDYTDCIKAHKAFDLNLWVWCAVALDSMQQVTTQARHKHYAIARLSVMEQYSRIQCFIRRYIFTIFSFVDEWLSIERIFIDNSDWMHYASNVQESCYAMQHPFIVWSIFVINCNETIDFVRNWLVNSIIEIMLRYYLLMCVNTIRAVFEVRLRYLQVTIMEISMLGSMFNYR